MWGWLANMGTTGNHTCSPFYYWGWIYWSYSEWHYLRLKCHKSCWLLLFDDSQMWAPQAANLLALHDWEAGYIGAIQNDAATNLKNWRHYCHPFQFQKLDFLYHLKFLNQNFNLGLLCTARPNQLDDHRVNAHDLTRGLYEKGYSHDPSHLNYA